MAVGLVQVSLLVDPDNERCSALFVRVGSAACQDNGKITLMSCYLLPLPQFAREVLPPRVTAWVNKYLLPIYNLNSMVSTKGPYICAEGVEEQEKGNGFLVGFEVIGLEGFDLGAEFLGIIYNASLNKLDLYGTSDINNGGVYAGCPDLKSGSNSLQRHD
ncbi:hypothetical protein BDR06DRAFT_970625 [Suillus hirtellus]|nr:hypothetical protein BDR06DRAFT_970625 [Suillus hirtellus]